MNKIMNSRNIVLLISSFQCLELHSGKYWVGQKVHLDLTKLFGLPSSLWSVIMTGFTWDKEWLYA